MGALVRLAPLLGGVLLVAAGVLLLSRSMHQLNRAGAFSTLYWASFRRYASYRARSLRPAIQAVLGLILVAVGLTVIYMGVATFFSGRLLTPG